MYPVRRIKPAETAPPPLNGYCKMGSQNGCIPRGQEYRETLTESDQLQLRLRSLGQLPNGYGSHYNTALKLAPRLASARPPPVRAPPIPAHERYYTSPYSRARPNRYYTQGRAITHNVVPTRREYVAEIGDRAGYGYNMWRMKVHYSYMDHCLTAQPLYYGYGPGYQTAPM